MFRISAVLISSFIMLWAITSASAQDRTRELHNSPESMEIKSAHKPVDAIELSRQPELPDFSFFTGQGEKFISGLEFTQLPGAAAYILQFACREKPKVVLDWYREMLNSNNWKVSDLSETSLRATSRTGHQCEINQLSRRRGEGCRYQINFKMLQKGMHR